MWPALEIVTDYTNVTRVEKHWAQNWVVEPEPEPKQFWMIGAGPGAKTF